MTSAPLSEKFSSGPLRRTVAVKMSAVVDRRAQIIDPEIESRQRPEWWGSSTSMR
jgi:hypothetical protein